jgi:hypothetical protein
LLKEIVVQQSNNFFSSLVVHLNKIITILKD